MFYDEIKKYDWNDTTRCIASKTARDVEIALGKEHLDIDDFMALISPAGSAYIEPMAQISQRLTQERFGKTISMYIPLYITNECCNCCVYCGFNHNNPFRRTKSRRNARQSDNSDRLKICLLSQANIRPKPESTIWNVHYRHADRTSTTLLSK